MAGLIKHYFENPALIISIFALLFTVGSFWWMNWRRGKLVVGKPGTFSATAHDDGYLEVQLPLVFYNKGPLAYIVNDLRLIINNNGSSEILQFTSTLAELGDLNHGNWASQFPVEGRRTYSSIFTFRKRTGKISFRPPECEAILEGKLNQKNKWKPVLKFKLYMPERVTEKIKTGITWVYSNDKDFEYS